MTRLVPESVSRVFESQRAPLQRLIQMRGNFHARDIVFNPAFTTATAGFRDAHFDARRSIYACRFFANVAEFGDSFIYTPEKERVERTIP